MASFKNFSNTILILLKLIKIISLCYFQKSENSSFKISRLIKQILALNRIKYVSRHRIMYVFSLSKSCC